MRFIKGLWILSFIGIFFMTCYIYASLGQDAKIVVRITQVYILSFSKTLFFYGIFTICVSYNILLIFLSSLTRKVPESLILVPNRKQWFYNQDIQIWLLKNYGDWLKGIGLILNGLLAYCTLLIYFSHIGNILLSQWILYFILAVLLVWISYFFWLFGNSSNNKLN